MQQLNNNPSIKVNNSTFSWDLEKGLFQYEGADVMLFWVESALKTLFDAIEEISGSEQADLVFETAGYRTGEIVSSFYKEQKGQLANILNVLPNIYASAGWGKTSIFYDEDTQTAVVQIANGWEDKMIQSHNKAKQGTFLPGHWAGVFSGLLDQPMWYELIGSQVRGDACLEIKISPSSITPAQNIREAVRREENAQITRLQEMVAEQTKELQALLKEISSPLIPVADDVIVIPLIGKYDTSRAQELIDKTLRALPAYHANYLILDLTAISDVNDYTISIINQLVQATKLLGISSILTGISPQVSVKMVESNFDLGELKCFTSLKHGIYYTFAQNDMIILNKNNM
jgi:anti-anti-sigma regulatory factor